MHKKQYPKVNIKFKTEFNQNNPVQKYLKQKLKESIKEFHKRKY